MVIGRCNPGNPLCNDITHKISLMNGRSVFPPVHTKHAEHVEYGHVRGGWSSVGRDLMTCPLAE